MLNDVVEEVEDFVEGIQLTQDEKDDIEYLLGEQLHLRFKSHDGAENGAPIPPKNMTCVTLHCGSKVSDCLADDQCRDSFACSGKCDPTDSTCTYMCSESYQSDAYDNLMHCMFEDHDCLTLPPPSPPNTSECRDPQSYKIPQITEELLKGTWYVNYGFNPDYDCFPC